MCLPPRFWNRSMSEELHHPEHQEVEYEQSDWNARYVYAFLLSLMIFGVLVYFAVKGMYGYLDARQRARESAPNPLVKAGTETERQPEAGIPDKFPEPRLETNERLEIR